MKQTVRTMLTSWRCLGIAVFVSWLALTVTLFVPNWELLRFGLSFTETSVWSRISFVLHFYGSLGSNFTLMSAFLTVTISILFGLQMATLVFYIKSMRHEGQVVKKTGVLSVSGFVSGLFGIGCSACGSVIVTGLLSTVGAGGLLALLPLKGEEFSFLAIGLLSYSLYYLLKAVSKGKVCAIF